MTVSLGMLCREPACLHKETSTASSQGIPQITTSLLETSVLPPGHLNAKARGLRSKCWIVLLGIAVFTIPLVRRRARLQEANSPVIKLSISIVVQKLLLWSSSAWYLV